MNASKPFANGIATLFRLAASSALVALTGWASAEALPKQGSFSVTTTIASTAPAAFDTGGGRWAAIFDARVIAINSAGSGLFNNTSGRCIGSDLAGRLSGMCIFIDGDGDKIVESIVREAGSQSGTGTLLGGTGKYQGIEGSYEFGDGQPLADTAPGQRNVISVHRGRYRLP